MTYNYDPRHLALRIQQEGLLAVILPAASRTVRAVPPVNCRESLTTPGQTISTAEALATFNSVRSG